MVRERGIEIRRNDRHACRGTEAALRPIVRRCERDQLGDRFAPALAIMISSPAAASSTSCKKCAFAARTLTVRMARDGLTWSILRSGATSVFCRGHYVQRVAPTS